MKLDKKLPFGVVTGHARARYEQCGVLFDVAGESIQPDKKAAQKDMIIETNKVVNSKDFLRNILRGGPLSKSAIFKVSEDSNQPWPMVKLAADALGMIRYQFDKTEMWKLPENELV